MTSSRSERRIRRSTRQLSDSAAVLLAVIAWVGASHPAHRPVIWCCLGVALCIIGRRPLLLLIAVGILAQSLAQRAEEGLWVRTGDEVATQVTLLTDPRPDELGGNWRAEVSYQDRRWQLLAPDEVAGDALDSASAGERVTVVGRTGRLPPGSDWLRARHVVGTLRAEIVSDVAPGSLLTRVANGIRKELIDGAESLGPARQALFSGFVLGDDRFQDPVDSVSFRRAGLTHLLAVSGQNVAFVLALCGPFLGRLRLGTRLGATLSVIALFALLTRFEPSVLRASVMAGLATVVVTLGREASSVRILALTVAGLVLVDPFLVDSIGFRLSVGASAGILFLAGPMSRRLRGPRPLVLALSVTAAAQLGVAPLLLATFGPVPLASVPANVLAGPASGPVMMWGMSAGLVAGLVPPAAPWIHRPTDWLLGWIEWVARAVPEALPGTQDAGHIVVTVSLLVIATRRRPPLIARFAFVVAALLFALRPGGEQLPTGEPVPVTAGVTAWVGADGTSVVVVDGRARPERALLSLSDARVDDVGMVIARTDAPGALLTADAIADDRRAPLVVKPGQLGFGGDEAESRVGCLLVGLGDTGDTIEVSVEPAAEPCGHR